MKHITFIACVFFVIASSAANAESIYRCGKGGNEYSQTPCANGSSIDASDDRSAAQLAEGRRVAAQDRRLGTQMEHDRLAHEAALRPAGAATITAKPVVAPTVVVVEPHRRKTRVVRVKAAARKR